MIDKNYWLTDQARSARILLPSKGGGVHGMCRCLIMLGLCTFACCRAWPCRPIVSCSSLCLIMLAHCTSPCSPSLCSTTSVSSFSTVHAHVRIKASTLTSWPDSAALANPRSGGACDVAEVTWSTCQLHTSTCWLHRTDTPKTHDRSTDTPIPLRGWHISSM